MWHRLAHRLYVAAPTIACARDADPSIQSSGQTIATPIAHTAQYKSQSASQR
jgi:hypothetical protein